MREILGRRRRLLFRRGGRSALLGAALTLRHRVAVARTSRCGTQPPAGSPAAARRRAACCAAPTPSAWCPARTPSTPACSRPPPTRGWCAGGGPTGPTAPIVLATGGTRALRGEPARRRRSPRAGGARPHRACGSAPSSPRPPAGRCSWRRTPCAELGELLLRPGLGAQLAALPRRGRLSGAARRPQTAPAGSAGSGRRCPARAAALAAARWRHVVDALVEASTSTPDGGSRLAY